MTILKTGRRGRPSLHVEPEVLKEALSSGRRISISALARAIGVHRHTIRKHLDIHNIPQPAYSTITDEDLDTLLLAYKELKPASGYRYAMGFLLDHGLRVQRERVKASLRRIDGLRHVLRNHAAIDRRVYVVPYPNYLWHIDGHHKLIRWGIVIHGGADGFDRMVSIAASACHHLQVPTDCNVADADAPSQYEQPGLDSAGAVLGGGQHLWRALTCPR